MKIKQKLTKNNENLIKLMKINNKKKVKIKRK